MTDQDRTPDDLRPEQEPLEVDYDPWEGVTFDREPS